MRYLALASDYDGTLAQDGVVSDATIRAIERFLHSGRRLILVTGRELQDLRAVFPRIDLCERVVAENGAVIYDPATRDVKILASPPPQSFVEDLRRRGVEGVSVGDAIVATWRPYEKQVMEAIRDSGLELQVVFNKDAVMVLPSGTNKMTGLRAALGELSLSAHNVVGIGDAENDHAFIESCECAVAVANAIPALKEKADYVTRGERGEGVAEIVEKIITNDLIDLSTSLRGKPILLGKSDDQTVNVPLFGASVLVCGQSGSGKSTLVTGLVERIIEKDYQICLIDPEGDYENLPGARAVGDEKQPPALKHLREALQKPASQVVVNLLSVAGADRPEFFAALIAEIQELRLRTGRPHWLIIDEAHHVLPSNWAPSSPELARQLSNTILITVHPGHVSPAALSGVNIVVVLGSEPQIMLDEFAKAIEKEPPKLPPEDLSAGQAWVWFREENRAIRVRPEPSRSEHHRHKRKYAQGELDPERSFYFRGPKNELNLRAQNLFTFIQLAEGVDAATWAFHLRRKDYSTWLRHSLGDEELADQIEIIEQDEKLEEDGSRERVKDAILERYTAPK
jgi:HAD superfamily hydrolase (TIGR01484 family)